MLGRLYVEDYRIANTRQMTDEEAAIKVQAGLRAMWARKYVDILRTYERTMKTMKEEEDKEAERKRKKERAKMYGGFQSVESASPNLTLTHSRRGVCSPQTNEKTDDRVDNSSLNIGLEDSTVFEVDESIVNHVYSPDEFDQMDAAVTIQAQVRGFVERKRNMVLSSRKSEEIMKIPEEVIEKE